jgi:hypothetical protein
MIAGGCEEMKDIFGLREAATGGLAGAFGTAVYSTSASACENFSTRRSYLNSVIATS